MRLFFALCRRKMPNGHIHRGKHRVFEPVTLEDAAKLKKEFAIEEKNMFYLRHAYLTPEQSKGHAKALGRNQFTNFRDRVLKQEKPFRENITIESQLGHLRCSEAWE